MFASRRRADEAYTLAAAARSESATAISEIRAHASFCTERESKRDGEHKQNQDAIAALTRSIGSLRNWIMSFLWAVAGSIILGLITALSYVFVHYVLPAHP